LRIIWNSERLDSIGEQAELLIRNPLQVGGG